MLAEDQIDLTEQFAGRCPDRFKAPATAQAPISDEMKRQAWT